ncbi:hypothetical protein JTB14_014670 [Gonioctena quinquepunctata]|nr:hypothetical protein JTB14_014670 [Gonioctena quinquepunctata]
MHKYVILLAVLGVACAAPGFSEGDTISDEAVAKAVNVALAALEEGGAGALVHGTANGANGTLEIFDDDGKTEYRQRSFDGTAYSVEAWLPKL